MFYLVSAFIDGAGLNSFESSNISVFIWGDSTASIGLWYGVNVVLIDYAASTLVYNDEHTLSHKQFEFLSNVLQIG